jgi:hypothetical protein
MQLQVMPLEWRKAKRYEVKQVRRELWVAGTDTLLGHDDGGLLGDTLETKPTPAEPTYEIAPRIVPCTKEEPYEVAVSPECKTSLALANTVRRALVTTGPLSVVPLEPWFAPACAFANEWGLPLRPTGSMWLSDFLPAAEEVRLALKALERGNSSNFRIGRTLQAEVADVEGELALRMKSLLALCWAEIIEAAERKDQFYSCQQCDKIGVQPGWGRPRSYCSGACRKAAERARAKGQP